MDWVVEISAGETASGALAPETEAAAHAAFREHGCVLLRGMFPPATVEDASGVSRAIRDAG
jgi:hypothetical protein